MRRLAFTLLLLFLLTVLCSGAAAQSISCPEAHLVLTVPDSWTSVPLSEADDPDLCLFLQGADLTLSVYVADAGGLMPDAFQVFTGDETESGTVTFGGVEMSYIAGSGPEGDYRIYTWPDRRNQVQLYFLVIGNRLSAGKTADEIMETLRFR